MTAVHGTSAAPTDAGYVKGDLVERWNASLSQLRSHRRGCTCDPCVRARSLLERIQQLLADVWPADKASGRDDRADRTSGNDA